MLLQIYKILSSFDANPLICEPTLFPGKTGLNIAKSKHVFPGKGRGDRALILTYLDSRMAEVFPHYCLTFLTFCHNQGGIGGQGWTKSFCLLEYYPWQEFRQYWTILGGVRA